MKENFDSKIQEIAERTDENVMSMIRKNYGDDHPVWKTITSVRHREVHLLVELIKSDVNSIINKHVNEMVSRRSAKEQDMNRVKSDVMASSASLLREAHARGAECTVNVTGEEIQLKVKRGDGKTWSSTFSFFLLEDNDTKPKTRSDHWLEWTEAKLKTFLDEGQKEKKS